MLRCPTCGAPSANNADGDWDQVTNAQWAAMFHAQELLAALKAVCAAWDNREDDYFPGMNQAQDAAEAIIAMVEGRSDG